MKRIEDWIPFEQVLEEHLRDPEFRAEWDRLAIDRALANRLVVFRADHDLTQAALARALGMTRQEIDDLEAVEEPASPETFRQVTEALERAKQALSRSS